MIQWRRPVIHAALRLTRSDVPQNLRTIRRLQRSDRETVERYRVEKLKRLLKHASQTVPYYNEVLGKTGVVDGGEVHLEHFTEIPLLTKERLRDSGERLVSRDPGSDPYTNTSGGTTGEPVAFVQDQHYWGWNVANKIFYQELAGKPLGGREVKLWGSERDILDGRETLRARLKNFLYNRRLLNTFRMSEADMREYVETINSFQPHTIWAYVESIHQIAQFVQREGFDAYAPNGIVTTAGTLHEPVRETIESAFDTTVYNQYGSREVGDMACECNEQDGLHVFAQTHYLEVVDEDGRPVDPGQDGRIVVTNLTNYSMPLVRYEIGDRGTKATGSCRCSSPFPRLQSVNGRVTDHFVSSDGDLIHGEYFTHLFYDRPWVRKFQARQLDPESVLIRVVPSPTETIPRKDIDEITDAIEVVMGEETDVRIEFVDEITETSSGKFRYIISDVQT
jgi:phenylacetate-CoA ligase